MDSNYKIYFGAVDYSFLTFDGYSIESINLENSVDIIGDEMSSDVMEFSVFFDDVNSTLRNTKYGTPIYLCNGEDLIGKFFFEKVERLAVKKYKVYTASMVGLIGREQYYGNFFSQSTFEDAINDVLFSSGLSTSLYSVYKPKGEMEYSGGGWRGFSGLKLTNESSSTETYRQRLQAAFTINDALSESGQLSHEDEVIGYSHSYSVSVRGERATVNSDIYYIVKIFYASNTPIITLGATEPIIGAGSYVAVDVDPLNGTAKMTVNYLKYDDPSITGTLEETANISVSTSTIAISLDVGFGPATNTGYADDCTVSVIWDYYRVYNADRTPRVDAGFAVDSSNKYYVFNKINGVYGQKQSWDRFVPYGSPVGVIGDLTRGGRDLELSSAIEYGFGVAGSLVNGWLPISTRREALHQLLFSQNVSLIKSAQGKMLFTGITNGMPAHIEDDDVYDENREESIPEARQIIVTEHSYTVPTGAAQVIFDNTDSPAITGDYLAIFNNAPIYGSLTASGITIRKSNCNCAIVAGRGTISGKPYVYAKREAKYQNTEAYDGADVSISNITLITGSNSDNVMNKLKAFYTGSLKKIMAGIIYRNQRCGVRYSFKTLFDDNNVGHLTKISSRASSFIKSDCEFISGYVSPPSGGYGNYQILEYGDEWVVPTEVREQQYPNIRLILIGTGHDGTDGTDGDPGDDATTTGGISNVRGGKGGKGGDAGVGGEGGKIYQITVDATNIAKITAELSGFHTVVKTYNDNNTLLNTYTSNSGNTADGGITNDFTGDVYARRGRDGVKGGDGGTGGGGDVWAGTNGSDVAVSYRLQPYFGGSCGPVPNDKAGVYYNGTRYWTSSRTGGGGGAAEGNNGGSGYVSSSTTIRDYTVAGKGADAVINPNLFTGYGSGGFGGSGGGGGGGAGLYSQLVEGGATTFVTQTHGLGGSGTNGTPGIDGCLLVYY